MSWSASTCRLSRHGNLGHALGARCRQGWLHPVAAFVSARGRNDTLPPLCLLLGTPSVPERLRHPGACHPCRLNPIVRGDQQVLMNAEAKKAACRELLFCCRSLLCPSLLGNCLAWTREGNSSLLSRAIFILYEFSGSVEGT